MDKTVARLASGRYVERRRLNNSISLSVMASLALVALSGCHPSLLSGIFVSNARVGEVDMIHLVESPPGRISGSVVISTIDANGARKQDVTFDVAGTITGSNVSLGPQGGLAGLAGLFGASTNLVGSLEKRVLTLSAGIQTETFQQVPQSEYDGELAKLNTVGGQVAFVSRTKEAIKQALSDGTAVNIDLQKYIAWGQQRIDHVATARQWYTDRTDRYSKCLQTIRPLAASKVPSWRWQDCVLSIQTDEYDRNQAVEAVRDFQRANQETVASLDSRIQTMEQQFPRMVGEVKLACAYVKNVDLCQQEFQKLNSLSPDGYMDSRLIATYRNLVPQVNAAISADTQTSAVGQTNLLAIQEQIDKVYRAAN